MFIAHIPIGLCLARWVSRRPLTKQLALIAACGAILPNLDLLRFYLLDNGQIHHHAYWTHLPAYWAVFMGLSILGFKLLKKPIPIELTVFLLAIFSHLVLDSVAGDIRWLWPVSDRGYPFVVVPSTHAKWYMSFLQHWTFKVEIFISLLALFMAGWKHGYKSQKNTRAHSS